MSGGTRCKEHGVEHFAVVCRMHNHSAFNGYHTTVSNYSEVRCTAPSSRNPKEECSARWRTTAAYVDWLPLDVMGYCPDTRERTRADRERRQLELQQAGEPPALELLEHDKH